MADSNTTFEQYKSPWRNLAWSFRESRDGWKRKHQELKRDFKRLQNQLRDVRLSRTDWQTQAEEARQEASRRQTQAEEARQEVSDIRNKVQRLEDELRIAHDLGEKKG